MKKKRILNNLRMSRSAILDDCKLLDEAMHTNLRDAFDRLIPRTSTGVRGSNDKLARMIVSLFDPCKVFVMKLR